MVIKVNIAPILKLLWRKNRVKLQTRYYEFLMFLNKRKWVKDI